MLQNYIYPRANSIFWSRAQNIPLPHSYVFPKNLEGKGTSIPKKFRDSETFSNHIFSDKLDNEDMKKVRSQYVVFTIQAFLLLLKDTFLLSILIIYLCLY